MFLNFTSLAPGMSYQRRPSARELRAAHKSGSFPIHDIVPGIFEEGDEQDADEVYFLSWQLDTLISFLVEKRNLFTKEAFLAYCDEVMKTEETEAAAFLADCNASVPPAKRVKRSLEQTQAIPIPPGPSASDVSMTD